MSLTDDILLMIFRQLDARSLTQVALTSARFYTLSQNPSLWVKLLNQDFNPALMLELFGPLDAKINIFERCTSGGSSNSGLLQPIKWQDQVDQNYPYMQNLLSYCDRNQYIKFYQRLTFQITLHALLHEYGQWDNAIEKLLNNWRAILRSPKSKVEFDTWIQNHSADQKRYEKIIAILAEKYLEKALTHAGARGHDTLLLDLIKMGGNAVNKAGKIALQRAVQEGHPICVDHLLKAGVKVTDDLLLFAVDNRYAFYSKHRGTKTLQLLIDAGTNIHVRGWGHTNCYSKFTPLLLACAYDNPLILNLLIDAGANLEDVGIDDAIWREGTINAYQVAKQNYHEGNYNVLCQAKSRQIERFCYQLLNATSHDENKVLAKWRAAGLNQSHLVEYLLSGPFSNLQQQIDILKLAMERNVKGESINPLACYLQSYIKPLKSKLIELESRLEIIYGSHRGTISNTRPYWLAYGPQNSKLEARQEIEGSARKQFTL